LQCPAGMAALLFDPKPGDVLGSRYILREQIGEGGMGIVFCAEQPALARNVAIKLLHPSLAHAARRFRNEARAASRVRHAGTIAILDCDFTGAPFIAMELVAGRPLSAILAEEDLPLPRVLGIADQILWSLEATHDGGVIHADIKTDNLLIDVRPERDVVTLIDFGLAIIDGSWIDPDHLWGTAEYLAPEVILGCRPTSSSDLYSAGVILYEMLTGTVPFTSASSQETLLRHLEDEPLPPSLRRPRGGIPPVLDEIVLRALDKDPQQRFANARDFATAVRAVLDWSQQ
jgi:eukaryotic-like serine/threonine-protein kinase